MCKVYSVASMKGGVTKTTTTLNLATALAIMGKKVFATDLDPQGSLSICASVPNPDKLTHTKYTLLDTALNEDESLNPRDYIIPCGKVEVIPYNIRHSYLTFHQGR